MRIRLDLSKDVHRNAEIYFNLAKKLKKKLPGLDGAIEKTKQEIEKIKGVKKDLVEREIVKRLKIGKWYEKFRYTRTSLGLLVVIGRDATSNEILLKKHLEDDDLVIHSMYPGSPFCLIKGGLSKAKDSDIIEAGQFTLSFSKAWKHGFGVADFFVVNPDQVSKKAPSGEFIKKGSFMIYGKKRIFKNIPLRIGLGYYTEEVDGMRVRVPFSGATDSCKSLCEKFVILEPGDLNYKKLGEIIKKKLGIFVDELPKFVPNYCKIAK